MSFSTLEPLDTQIEQGIKNNVSPNDLVESSLAYLHNTSYSNDMIGNPQHDQYPNAVKGLATARATPEQLLQVVTHFNNENYYYRSCIIVEAAKRSGSSDAAGSGGLLKILNLLHDYHVKPEEILKAVTLKASDLAPNALEEIYLHDQDKTFPQVLCTLREFGVSNEDLKAACERFNLPYSSLKTSGDTKPSDRKIGQDVLGLNSLPDGFNRSITTRAA